MSLSDSHRSFLYSEDEMFCIPTESYLLLPYFLLLLDSLSMQQILLYCKANSML